MSFKAVSPGLLLSPRESQGRNVRLLWDARRGSGVPRARCSSEAETVQQPGALPAARGPRWPGLGH